MRKIVFIVILAMTFVSCTPSNEKQITRQTQEVTSSTCNEKDD